MPIRENKGKWDRGNLRDSKVKAKHPLNFKMKSVASHHIISCDTLEKLSTSRKRQIIRKGYDVNHQKNLVILPMIDQISCQFMVPLHKSGHKDHEIIRIYGERTGEEPESEMDSLLEDEKNAPEENQDQVLVSDLASLGSALGYHKIVAQKLAFKLKSISCDTSPRKYIDEIDDVSLDVLGDISSFDLLLIFKGKDMEEDEVGCSVCQEINDRHVHYNKRKVTFLNLIKPIPKQSVVNSFCYKGNKIRLLNVREQINK